jgi:hypothetical protein
MPTVSELQGTLNALTTELASTRQATADAKQAAYEARDPDEAIKALAHGLVSDNLERDLAEQVTTAQAELNEALVQEFTDQVVPNLEQLDALIETAIEAFRNPIQDLATAAVEREQAIAQARLRAGALGQSEGISLSRPSVQVGSYALRSTNAATAAILSGMLAPVYAILRESVLAAELEARRKVGTSLSYQ